MIRQTTAAFGLLLAITSGGTALADQDTADKHREDKHKEDEHTDDHHQAEAAPDSDNTQQVSVKSSKRQSLAEQYIDDIREGRLASAGEHAAVTQLLLNRDIPIPARYVESLMWTPNAFGPGPACVICHSSNDPARSYRGLDLRTCDGILRGSLEEPVRLLFEPGQSPKRSVIGRRLRNNRMPFGVQFDVSTGNIATLKVRRWIAEGAPDDEHFRDEVLPLFSTANAFAPDTPACTTCHMSNDEPPSFHELDLTSHAGIMLGADSIAKGVDHATKVVLPGDPDDSSIFQHLVENRMPPGISPAEDRDHPNTLILLEWIKQGANCE